jgi:hypothetical protein
MFKKNKTQEMEMFFPVKSTQLPSLPKRYENQTHKLRGGAKGAIIWKQKNIFMSLSSGGPCKGKKKKTQPFFFLSTKKCSPYASYKHFMKTPQKSLIFNMYCRCKIKRFTTGTCFLLK